MPGSVTLPAEIITLVRREANIQGRSLEDQLSRWIRLAAALEGKISTTDLQPDEEIAWLDAFTEQMGQPTAGERAFFARKRLHEGRV